MHVLITGSQGFLGRKLAAALVKRGWLAGRDGERQQIDSILLTDIVEPSAVQLASSITTYLAGDIAEPNFVRQLFTQSPDSIFHFAALVSGGAERDFAAGYRANLHGTLNLLEAARASGKAPRFVFASSIAAYGGDLPETISDDHKVVPESSYGTQKAIGELLVSDYSRKGFIDGRSFRLPIIAVRGGAANTATSSWASGIVREPLSGRTYDCPVNESDRGFLLSPRRAIDGLVNGHDSDAKLWGRDRSVMMPGLEVTAGEIVEGLRRVAGPEVASRVRWVPDEFVRRIITSWPVKFSLDKARRIGLSSDARVDEIIRSYIAEDAPGAQP